MCFSNLPIEFDEDGNPYLADRAEDVDRPDAGTHAAGCGCEVDDADLAADPEHAYEAILASLPASARDRVADGEAAGDGGSESGSGHRSPPSGPNPDAGSAGGD